MEDVYRRLVGERVLWHDRATTAIALASFAILLTVLGIGTYLGLQAGLLFSGEAQTATAERIQGLLTTTPAWLVPLGLLGLSGLMAAVVVALRRIIRTIRLRRDAAVTSFPHLIGTGRGDA